MEGTRVLREQGYIRDIGMEGDMGMDGTRVWKGHGYGWDTGMKGTRVWMGHGYEWDTGMERTIACEGMFMEGHGHDRQKQRQTDRAVERQGGRKTKR